MKKTHLIVLVPLLAGALVLIQGLATTKGRASLNGTGSKQSLQATRGSAGIRPAPFASAPVSLHAQGRGNPWINLGDGHDLVTDYSGAASKQILESHSAEPLALAAGDFDEDGVPDLISGFAVSGVNNGGLAGSAGDAWFMAGWGAMRPGANQGLLTLHRGNVDAIYPNTAEAEQRKIRGEFTDAPFLSPATVFALPEAPDFIGAGDFDADGHWDLAAATRGSFTGWRATVMAGLGKRK